MLLKLENIKGGEKYIGDDKNFQKLGLLGFLLFLVQVGGVRVLLNPWKTCVNKISALKPANVVKLANSF